MDTEPPSPTQDRISKNAIIMGILVALIVVMGSILALLYLRTRNAAPKQTNTESIPTIISGSFDINGMVPEGSSISLTAKDLSKGHTQVVASGIAPNDDGTWSFDKAVPGTSYIVQGSLMADGKTIAQSDPITITAPAGQETITFNIPSATQNTITANSVISSNIVVNGYIPTGSIITIQGRKLGDQAFTKIASSLPGQPRQFMTYTAAQAGSTYQIVGILYASKGTNIGTSSILTVDAPATNETITINSLAKTPTVTPTAAPTPSQKPTPSSAPATATPTPTPTPAPAQISGTIDFNGVAPGNSHIVILEKVYNTQNYHVAVDNISPSDGITWTWTNPQPSTWYDLIAVLKQRQSNGTDKDIATSSVVSVAAPATTVTLTINSGISLSAPTGSIMVSCDTLSGSNWTAKVTFGHVDGAGSYWYQIGTTDGGVELSNATQNASGTSDLVVPLQFVRGTRYYARYAYASLANQSANSSQFSPFTPTTPLQCN